MNHHARMNNPVVLHPLVYLVEGNDVTVGRPDTDSFAVLAPDGAQLIRRLEAGATPRQAAEWYELTYGLSVDISAFLDELVELAFVRGDDAGAGQEKMSGANPVRWRRLGSAAFSRPAWCCYLLLLGWAAVLMVRDHDLWPSYRHVFFTGSLTITQLTLMAVQLPSVLLHEAAHVLAGRRLGLQTRLSIGRRFYFIVFETSIKGLAAVPRRQRFLPILAGPLVDLLVIAALTLIAAGSRAPDGRLSMVGRVCLAISFTAILRLVWQLYLHLRTDGYFLFSTVLGCYDLHRVAHLTLRNRLYRLLGQRKRVVDERGWHPVDRRVARWYSWLMLLGYVLTGATAAFAVVPAALTFLQRIAAGLVTGGAVSGTTHLDIVVSLVINLLQFCIVGVLVARDLRRRWGKPSVRVP